MKYWICFVMLSYCLINFLEFGRTPAANKPKLIGHLIAAAIFGFFTYYLWGHLA